MSNRKKNKDPTAEDILEKIWKISLRQKMRWNDLLLKGNDTIARSHDGETWTLDKQHWDAFRKDEDAFIDIFVLVRDFKDSVFKGQREKGKKEQTAKRRRERNVRRKTKTEL